MMSFTRLLCRRNLDIHQFRGLYTSSSLSVLKTAAIQTSCSTVENHDERNMRLKRPLSPHLTIYQPQLTSMLSLSHRTTGIILASYAMTLGFGTLLIPGGIPCLINMVEHWCLPSVILILGKALLALPFTFHYVNGFRHLAWDLGKFLTIKEVYSTGYLASGLAIIGALILAVM